jgi:hypothetical protein
MVRPLRCPRGHPLRPGRMLVGSIACSCGRHLRPVSHRSAVTPPRPVQSRLGQPARSKRWTPVAIYGRTRMTGHGTRLTRCSDLLRTHCGRKRRRIDESTGQQHRAGELACKPDSVPRYQVTRRRPSIWAHRHRVPRAADPQARASNPPAPARPHRGAVFLALLRVGFAEPFRSPGMLVRSYRTVSPLLPGSGLFSVALSRESPRIAVSNHPAL